MEFTDLNLLSLDYLLTELVRWQKADIRTFEQFVAELAEGSEDRVARGRGAGQRPRASGVAGRTAQTARPAAEDRRRVINDAAS